MEYEGETLGIIHNNSAEELSYDLSGYGCDFGVICQTIGMGGANLEGSVLTLAAQTSVIMK